MLCLKRYSHRGLYVRRRQRRVVVRFSGNGPLTFPRLLDVVADAANVARKRFAGPCISEVRGKIENLRAQPDFQQQNRRSRKPKTGARTADIGFSPHFRKCLTEVCGKFLNSRAQRTLRVKKPQVEVLVVFCVVGISRICRILSV